MKQNKILSLLGLAGLVIVAEDASANTRKMFTDKCSFYEIPIYIYGTKADLGRAIGRAERASLAVCDAGLAQAVQKLLEQAAADQG